MDLPVFLTTIVKHLRPWKQVFVRINIVLVLSALCLGTVPPVQAATRDNYQASLLSIAAPARLAPGEMGQVRLEIKNTGTVPWLKTGGNFVSLYRWDPIKKLELASQLKTLVWETVTRPLRLPIDRLEPGKTAVFTFPIKAPSFPGRYTETFILAAEDMAWMKNSQAAINLEVTTPTSAVLETRLSTPTSVPYSSTLIAVAQPAPTSNLQPLTTSSGWSAELVEKSGNEWQLDPESNVKITLKFLNNGTKTWTRDSANSISLYATEGAKERASVFKTAAWNGNAAARLKELQVPPGQIGTFTFEVRAPRIAATYKETFSLAAENIAFLPGSSVTLPIRVIAGPTSEFVASGLPEEASPIAPAPNIGEVATGPSRKALLLLRSLQGMTLLGNGRQEMQVGFKNVGEATWNSRALRLKGVTPVITQKWGSVRDESWFNATEPVRIQGDVKPGEIGFLTFKLKAPAKKGSYTVSLGLYTDGLPVEGGDIDIPITVTADGYIEPEPVLPPAPTPTTRPNTPTPTPLISFPPITPVPLNGDESSLPNEPMIRVGIFRTTDDQMVIRAKQVPVVVSQSGTTICRLNTGESATVQFDRTNRVYKLSGGSCRGQSSGIYLFRTEDGVAPMEIADFSRPVSGTNINDNMFRSQLELRFTPATDGVWVINELPIEWYLKGIAETSNISPPEFQRTLLVTARTYAMYHVQRGTKHADEFYTVDAKYDQVYRGYGAESRNPNVVAAIDATRGQIVTYQGKLAITPYFSRSDGRTRSWGEVWYGASQYPWLLSVPVPQDQGKTLWGHGVGMSASGALAMANEGQRYDQILTYFYQGTEIRKAYK